MVKNNYFLPFLVFLILTVFLGVLLFINPFSPGPLSCEICPEEKALMEGVLGSWGENLYDSSEYLIDVDVTNYGYQEGKNIEVACKIYKADEDGVALIDAAITTVRKSIGNVASTSYKQVELSLEKDIRFGETPVAVCFINSCDGCEILYKRVPELVEVYDKT